MHLNLSFIPLLLWLEKKIFSFFGTLRMQQEARENAVARWIPPHSCVDLGLQPDFFALGDVDRQTSGSHLSQGREKPTERTLLECQISVPRRKPAVCCCDGHRRAPGSSGPGSSAHTAGYPEMRGTQSSTFLESGT